MILATTMRHADISGDAMIVAGYPCADILSLFLVVRARLSPLVEFSIE